MRHIGQKERQMINGETKHEARDAHGPRYVIDSEALAQAEQLGFTQDQIETIAMMSRPEPLRRNGRRWQSYVLQIEGDVVQSITRAM